MYSVLCTLCNTFSIYNVLCTWYSVLGTMYYVLCTRYSVLYTQYSVMYRVLCTMYFVLCIQYSAMYYVLCTQHCVLKTLNHSHVFMYTKTIQYNRVQIMVFDFPPSHVGFVRRENSFSVRKPTCAVSKIMNQKHF